MSSKKTVTICGLLPRQVEVVRAKCRNSGLRLRFILKKSHGSRLPPSDLFIVTRFVDHSITSAARKLAGPHRVVFHSGGLSTLITRVLGAATDPLVDKAA